MLFQEDLMIQVYSQKYLKSLLNCSQFCSICGLATSPYMVRNQLRVETKNRQERKLLSYFLGYGTEEPYLDE